MLGRFVFALVMATALLLQCNSVFAQTRPVVMYTSVNAFSTDRFEPIWFRAGEFARVTVSGDGDTDLDLYVYDAAGNLVARDDDRTDQCIATWVPRRSGWFYIQVVNLGSVYNAYTLRTN